ncbi:MAG TPA: N-acetyltransferase, partial [Ruegeria sp.]|nr:N-acetyltransferase [Ruegeria sp.]
MTPVAPYRIAPDSPQIGAILALIRDSFAFMDGRIDPPSSMHRLTEQAVAAQAAAGEVWAL